jgi:hypothetical protein
MRYLVLILMATAIAGGFVVLREALSQEGERFYGTLGFAAIMLSGPLYLIWNTFAFGVFFAKEHSGEVPQALRSLDDIFDLLLFLAGFLTYLATVAFAASLGRVQWLGRKATRAFMIVNGVALLFLVIRGVHFPDPRALSAPWYTSPGFVVGIPAVPFIMPFLFGVVLLRRAGDAQSQKGPNLNPPFVMKTIILISLLAILCTSVHAQDPIKTSPQYYKVLLGNVGLLHSLILSRYSRTRR